MEKCVEKEAVDTKCGYFFNAMPLEQGSVFI